jgi:hypothetical protein
MEDIGFSHGYQRRIGLQRRIRVCDTEGLTVYMKRLGFCCNRLLIRRTNVTGYLLLDLHYVSYLYKSYLYYGAMRLPDAIPIMHVQHLSYLSSS